MKQKLIHCCAVVLIGVLCVGCSESMQGPGLGEEIAGMKTYQATGTFIGSYSNGFISKLVQVDEEYPIGKTIEYFGNGEHPLYIPVGGTYKNVIQVQYTLLVKTGSRISFFFREYQEEKDRDLFIGGAGLMLYAPPPDVPIYTITEYKILNN